MKVRVSDYIVQFLSNLGVDKIFLVSGGGMMYLLDAIAIHPLVSVVAHHHEQSAVMAAEGYARLHGKLGVSFVTSGPGAPNAVTGVVGAWLDSMPLLVVSGQAKLSQTNQYRQIEGLRQYGAYDVPSVSIMKPITKYSTLLADPKAVRYEIEKAVYLATTGRPGPVFIDVPLDIQGALVETDDLVGYVPEASSSSVISQDQLEEIIIAIQNSRRPVILAGHGIRSSHAFVDFQKLIEILQVPVVTTQMATDLMGHEDPLFVGRCGVKGDRAGNLAIQMADFILILGSSLHVTTTGYEVSLFAPKALKILIDPDAGTLAREQVNVQIKICSSLNQFIPELSDYIQKNRTLIDADKSWKVRCQAWKRELSVAKEPHKRSDKVVNYYDFIDALSKVSDSEDVLVTDAGSAWYLISQAYKVQKGQRVILSGGLGTMGFAMPCATGLASAGATRVLCITGDGSAMTALHELAVFKANNLNIKLIIMNNDGYASIRNTQNSYFNGRLAATGPESGLAFPKFENIAQSLSLPYRLVAESSQLENGLSETLCSSGPFVLEIITDKIQEIIPTVTTVRHDDGRLESKPLDEMAPFLEEHVIERLISDFKK
jgi:acetolactate synthase I/II/III large subunit